MKFGYFINDSAKIVNSNQNTKYNEDEATRMTIVATKMKNGELSSDFNTNFELEQPKIDIASNHQLEMILKEKKWESLVMIL